MNCSPQSAPWTGTSPAYTQASISAVDPSSITVSWATPNNAQSVSGSLSWAPVSNTFYYAVIVGNSMEKTPNPPVPITAVPGSTFSVEIVVHGFNGVVSSPTYKTLQAPAYNQSTAPPVNTVYQCGYSSSTREVTLCWTPITGAVRSLVSGSVSNDNNPDNNGTISGQSANGSVVFVDIDPGSVINLTVTAIDGNGNVVGTASGVVTVTSS